MYHAESFAKIGWETLLVGYGGEFSSLPSRRVALRVRIGVEEG